MNFSKILVPIAGVALVVVGYQNFGWGGVAVVVGGMVMFVLLHFTRMMKVFTRAAEQPIGYVASAVMLNAKLKPGVNLLHVVAMTRSLGALQSPKDTQPEIFRWTDSGESHVTCEFRNGKLASWTLWRPTQPENEAALPQEATPPQA